MSGENPFLSIIRNNQPKPNCAVGAVLGRFPFCERKIGLIFISIAIDGMEWSEHCVWSGKKLQRLVLSLIKEMKDHSYNIRGYTYVFAIPISMKCPFFFSFSFPSLSRFLFFFSFEYHQTFFFYSLRWSFFFGCVLVQSPSISVIHQSSVVSRQSSFHPEKVSFPSRMCQWGPVRSHRVSVTPVTCRENEKKCMNRKFKIVCIFF